MRLLTRRFAGSEYPVAEESSKLMMELFPEIKDFSDMHFRELCKKTRGRFKASTLRPDPLEPRLRVHMLYRDRIRRNVLAVADLSLRLVPSLTLRLAPLEERVRAERRSRNRQLYLRMSNLKNQQLSDVRVSVMRDLVHQENRDPRRTVGVADIPHPGPANRSKVTVAAPPKVPDYQWSRQQKKNVSVRVSNSGGFHHPHLFDLSTIHENGPSSQTTQSTTITGNSSLRVCS